MSPTAEPRETAPDARQGAVSEQTLSRIQGISGLIFATFLVLHLANTMLATAGQGTYDAYQRVARWYYQFPIVEIVAVLGAAVAHIAAGVLRIVRRRRRARASQVRPAVPSLRVRLHRWSGYCLMLVFAGHVAATRVPGLLGHPADFSFLTFSLKNWPAYFYPYYGVFALSGVYHLTHGTIVALRMLEVRLPASATVPRSGPFWALASVLGVAVLVGILGLGGRLFDVDTHRFGEFEALYDRVFPASMRPWAK